MNSKPCLVYLCTLGLLALLLAACVSPVQVIVVTATPTAERPVITVVVTPEPPAATPVVVLVTAEPVADTATPLPPSDTPAPVPPTVTPALLPKYSEIIQASQACCTGVEVLSVSADGKKWVFSGGGKLCPGKSELTLEGSEFSVDVEIWGESWKCYGAKFTINQTQSVMIDGKTYTPGTKLTVDKNLNWIEVSSWD